MKRERFGLPRYLLGCILLCICVFDTAAQAESDTAEKKDSALDEKILSPYKRILDTNIRHEIKKTVKVPKADNKLSLSVFCETYNQLIATKKICANNLAIKEISFEADTIKPEFWKKEVEKLKAINVKANLYMPHIFRMESREFFEKNNRIGKL